MKILIAVQDMLLWAGKNMKEAITPKTQKRGGKMVEVTPINIYTIPAQGALGLPDFMSIADYIEERVSNPRVKEWRKTSRYKRGDCILYENKIIVCIRACKGKSPEEHPEYWAGT